MPGADRAGGGQTARDDGGHHRNCECFVDLDLKERSPVTCSPNYFRQLLVAIFFIMVMMMVVVVITMIPVVMVPVVVVVRDKPVDHAADDLLARVRLLPAPPPGIAHLVRLCGCATRKRGQSREGKYQVSLIQLLS